MKNKGFEGWYFKHQKGNDTVALIPGRAESGAFVQMISPSGTRQFDVPALAFDGNLIRAGDCQFSNYGCKIDLPNVCGEIVYGKATALHSDIMGPFRYFPMECRHGVISMMHTLTGSICIDGTVHCFDGGIGYTEKDSGTSFPKSYQWLQCNDFNEPCSLMISIARIPFCGLSFTGCICAIVHRGREYRLATYNGVQIHAAEERHICLTQGKLLLEINVCPSHGGYPLRAPARGQMSEMIRESTNASISARLWENRTPIFDLKSCHATCEFVPPKES